MVWCRKPENEKQTNKQIDQKIRHTAQGLLSLSTFPAYLVVMFSLARKMVFSHRQASSLVSSFWSARNRLRTAAARAKAEHLRFASRVFISYFTSHKRKSCPQKPDYACTRESIKEFYQDHGVVSLCTDAPLPSEKIGEVGVCTQATELWEQKLHQFSLR